MRLHGGDESGPDRDRAEAGGEGQRHELGLVAKLGDEHHAEADHERDEDAVHVGVLLKTGDETGA